MCPLQHPPPPLELTVHVRCSSPCRQGGVPVKGKQTRRKQNTFHYSRRWWSGGRWRGSSAAGYDTRRGADAARAGLVFFTVPGRRLRLNYSVSCIVVLLLFTVIAHHLKAHSYNQTTRHRNVLFSECTCESSLPPHHPPPLVGRWLYCL